MLKLITKLTVQIKFNSRFKEAYLNSQSLQHSRLLNTVYAKYQWCTFALLSQGCPWCSSQHIWWGRIYKNKQCLLWLKRNCLIYVSYSRVVHFDCLNPKAECMYVNHKFYIGINTLFLHSHWQTICCKMHRGKSSIYIQNAAIVMACWPWGICNLLLYRHKTT